MPPASRTWRGFSTRHPWRDEKASAPASPPAGPNPPCPAMLGALKGGLTAKATATATSKATAKLPRFARRRFTVGWAGFICPRGAPTWPVANRWADEACPPYFPSSSPHRRGSSFNVCAPLVAVSWIPAFAGMTGLAEAFRVQPPPPQPSPAGGGGLGRFRFLTRPLQLPLSFLWLLLGLLPWLCLFRSPHCMAPSIASIGGGSGHGCPLRDTGPWMARYRGPRRSREAQGIGSRLCFSRVDDMLGPPFFGYFLQRLKKVTRALARNSAQQPTQEYRRWRAWPGLLQMQCRQRIADLRLTAAPSG